MAVFAVGAQASLRHVPDPRVVRRLSICRTDVFAGRIAATTYCYRRNNEVSLYVCLCVCWSQTLVNGNSGSMDDVVF